MSTVHRRAAQYYYQPQHRPLGLTSHGVILSASLPHPGPSIAHHHARHSPSLSTPFKILPSRLIDLTVGSSVLDRVLVNGTQRQGGASGQNYRGDGSSDLSPYTSSSLMVVDAGWKETDTFRTQPHIEISPAAFLPVLLILLAVLSLVGYVWCRRRTKESKQLIRLRRVFDVLEKVSLIDKERWSVAEERVADEVHEALIASYSGFTDYDSPFYQPSPRMPARPGSSRLAGGSTTLTTAMKGMTPKGGEVADRLSRLGRSQ